MYMDILMSLDLQNGPHTGGTLERETGKGTARPHVRKTAKNSMSTSHPLRLSAVDYRISNRRAETHL